MARRGRTAAAAVSAMRAMGQFIGIVSPGQADSGIVDDAARCPRISQSHHPHR